MIENYQHAARRLASARGILSPRRPTPRCWRISSGTTTTCRRTSDPVQRLVEAPCGRRSRRVKGTYGIAVMHADCAGRASSARGAAARWWSGSGKGENFLASDVSAIVAHTRDVIYLNDYDIVTLTRDDFEVKLARWRQRACEVSRSSSPRTMRRRATSRTTCSRKSTSSRTRIRNAMRGRLSREEATADARRPGDDAAGAARRRPHHPHRLRHRVPRGAWSASTSSKRSRTSRPRSSSRASSATAIAD